MDEPRVTDEPPPDGVADSQCLNCATYFVQPAGFAEPECPECGSHEVGSIDPALMVPAQIEEYRWTWMDLDQQNIADLMTNVNPTGDALPLIGIVDDEAGGIVAYAIGHDNAERITAALNQ